MTLFYMTIDPIAGRLGWVRTGHDPAILYDPATERFEELRGDGIALGVDRNWRYVENHKADLTPGQIIFLGTDGIRETRNPHGKMFGKNPVCDVLRKNASLNAEGIITRMVKDFDDYRGNREPEDDITLMVIKVASGGPLR